MSGIAARPRRCEHRSLTTFGFLSLLFVVASGAWAQEVQPGDERPDIPEFETHSEGADAPLPRVPRFEREPEPPGSALPKLVIPDRRDLRLQASGRILVNEIRVIGATELSPESRREIRRRYEGRELSFSEIQALRDDITRAYVSAGFITSGAVVPSQSLENGVLIIEVQEGELVEIAVQTDGSLHERYVRSRLARSAGPPVNVDELRQRLLILQQDDRIHTVRAQILPTEERAEARLKVDVRETSPFYAFIAGSNYSTPSLGEWRTEAGLGHQNLTGFGDAIFAGYRWSEGLQDVRGSYTVPLTRWDTRLELAGRYTESEIIEEPFDDLDIESEIESYAISLHQPVHHTVNAKMELFAKGEYRRSESFLFGSPFSFALGPQEGESKVAVLRGGWNFTYRSATQVWALRGQATWGIDAFDATRSASSDIPDGEFVSGLVQVQWAWRTPLWGIQVRARADAQVANNPLLGIEQFSIGGRNSIRGYRENQLVRDTGWIASGGVQFPVPLPGFGRWRPHLAITPFYDIGYARNNRRGQFPRGSSETLHSAGVRGTLELLTGLELDLSWAYPLKNVPGGGEHALQDDGIHLQLRYRTRGWPWASQE